MKLGHALERTETVQGVQDEYAAFSELLRSLSDEEWRTPCRCEGWEVRDLAGHVVGLATDTVAGKPGSRNSQEEAEAAHGRAPIDLADELDAARPAIAAILGSITDEAWEGPSPLPDLTLRQGVHTLWYDTWVHGDDIRAALGRPTDRNEGLRGTVAYLAEMLEFRGWGPATLQLDGIEEIRIGQGEGPVVTGDPLRFVLAATGRADGAELGLDDKVNIYA
jgi:uncharacterized protein (TIGR03083 family)